MHEINCVLVLQHQHRNPSSNEAQNSAVYLHLIKTGHTINIKDATILDKEEHYNRRGIKEAIWGKSGITITQQEGRTKAQFISCMGQHPQANS